jgi:DNA/RNA endonuclease G (NUC1)
MVRKQTYFILLGLLAISCSQPEPAFSQDLRERVEFNIDDLFYGVYSEVLEQPLEVSYTVPCPDGDASRSGLDFYTHPTIHTSDDDDYSNNVWDKGHLAPAAAFSCDRETIKKTFTYLNSALQHQSLNRGIWNRLETFERDLANFFEVSVKIEVLFEGNPQILSTGATVPTGFRKTIEFADKKVTFEFPNGDTSGTDWIDYLIN